MGTRALRMRAQQAADSSCHLRSALPFGAIGCSEDVPVLSWQLLRELCRARKAVRRPAPRMAASRHTRAAATASAPRSGDFLLFAFTVPSEAKFRLRTAFLALNKAIRTFAYSLLAKEIRLGTSYRGPNEQRERQVKVFRTFCIGMSDLDTEFECISNDKIH